MTREDRQVWNEECEKARWKRWVLRRKEDEVAKMQIAGVDTKLCSIFLCPTWNVGL